MHVECGTVRVLECGELFVWTTVLIEYDEYDNNDNCYRKLIATTIDRHRPNCFQS